MLRSFHLLTNVEIISFLNQCWDQFWDCFQTNDEILSLEMLRLILILFRNKKGDHFLIKVGINLDIVSEQILQDNSFQPNLRSLPKKCWDQFWDCFLTKLILGIISLHPYKCWDHCLTNVEIIFSDSTNTQQTLMMFHVQSLSSYEMTLWIMFRWNQILHKM